MEKKAKRFWRYFGPTLVLLEVCNYLILKNNSFWCQIACMGFLAVNCIIIAHLVGIKIKVEQHNAKVDAEAKAASKVQARRSVPAMPSEPVSAGNVMPAIA